MSKLQPIETAPRKIMQEILYGLWHIKRKQLLTVTAFSNEGYDCVGVQYDLGTSGEMYWLVSDRAVAEKASVHSEASYNAHYYKPMNSYIGETKVVKVVVCVDEEESL
jgi:hypothetical protein